jgi:hypothetical protein
MKNYCFLFIGLIIFTLSCTPPKFATEEEKRHEFIKEFPGKSKDLIFEKTYKWIAENFKSAKAVIDYQDKQAGTIIAKGIIDVSGGNFKFTLTVDIKEGKARYRYTNLIWLMLGGDEIEVISQDGHKLVHQRLDQLTTDMSFDIQKDDNF